MSDSEQRSNMSRFPSAKPLSSANPGYCPCGEWDGHLDGNGECAWCRAIREANAKQLGALKS